MRQLRVSLTRRKQLRCISTSSRTVLHIIIVYRCTYLSKYAVSPRICQLPKRNSPRSSKRRGHLIVSNFVAIFVISWFSQGSSPLPHGLGPHASFVRESNVGKSNCYPNASYPLNVTRHEFTPVASVSRSLYYGMTHIQQIIPYIPDLLSWLHS